MLHVAPAPRQRVQPSLQELREVATRSMSHLGKAEVRGFGKVRKAGLPSSSPSQLLDPFVEACVSSSWGGLWAHLSPQQARNPPNTTLLGQALLPDNVTLKRSPSPPPKRRLRKALRSILSRYTQSQSSSKSFILSSEQLLQHPRPQLCPQWKPESYSYHLILLKILFALFHWGAVAEVNLGLIHMLERRWKVVTWFDILSWKPTLL